MGDIIQVVDVPAPLAIPGFEFPPATVRVLVRLNPFDPGDVRTCTLDWMPDETLSALLRRADLDASRWVVTQNGIRIPEEDHDVVIALPGASIVVFPRIAGGSWVTLLVMSAALLTGFAAAALLLTYSALAIGSVLTISAAAASIGGSLASWALQPSPPSSPSFSMTYDPAGPKSLAQPGVPVPKGYGTMAWGGNCISSYVQYQGRQATIFALYSYGFGTAKSITAPLLNGRAISTYENVSYVVRNGYPGVPAGTTITPNNDKQSPIPGFNRTENGYPMETELLVSNGPVVYQGIGTNVQGFDITTKFPTGLYHVSAHGNFVPIRISYLIEISPHGLNQWTAPLIPRDDKREAIYNIFQDGVVNWPKWVLVPTDRFAGSNICYAYDDNEQHTAGDQVELTQNVDVYDYQGHITTQQITVKGEWQPTDQSIGWQQVTGWWSGYRVLLESIQAPFFDTVSIYGLAPGQYDIRLTKIGYQEPGQSWVLADSTDSHYVTDIWFWNVNEVTLDDLAYPSMILVGVKGVANAQLNGASMQLVPTIQHGLGTDTVIPAQLASFEDDNPAIVAFDLLTNPFYGGGVPVSNIDLPAWVEWAQFCDEQVTNQDGSVVRRFIFNGVFDQTVTLWQALGMIGTMSRAAVLQYGALYTVMIDAPGDPVQLFTAASMVEDSFREVFTSTADRATIFEVKFADAARNYRTDLPVTLMGANALNGPVVPRTVSRTLTGCTDRDQAWRWAYFHLLTNQYCLRTIQFTTALEGVACRLGSLIAVQTDFTNWANGGRIQDGSTAQQIVTEQPNLQFTSGAGWTISVLHPVVERGTVTIASVSADVVTCTTALPTGRIVKAVSPAGVEYIVQGTSGQTITLESAQPLAAAAPLAAGMVLTLFDQAVIDTFLVTGISQNSEGNSVLSIAPNSFSATPTTDCPWMYGQSSGAQPGKVFRVVGMNSNSDMQAQITAVEYNPLCYVDAIPNYSSIIGPPNTDATVTDLSVVELYQNGAITNSLDTSLVSVSWRNSNKAVGGVLYTRVMPANGLATTTENLLPDTDLTQGATFWGNTATVNSLFSISSISSLNDNGFVYSNTTGSPYSPTNPVAPCTDFSSQVPVTPGSEYTLSAYIDASHVSGTNAWGLYLFDANSGAIIAQLVPTAGAAAGRYSVTFTVPQGTVSVMAAPWTTGGTVAASTSVSIAQPMLQQSPAATGYVSGAVPGVLGQSGWSVQQYVRNGNSATFLGTMGVTYEVQVRGLDAAGNLGQTPLYGTIGVQGYTNAPSGPAGFTVTQTSAGNVLTWTASPGAAQYLIQYRDTEDIFALNIPVTLATVTGTTWTDSQVRTGIYVLFAQGPLPAQIQSAPVYASLVPPPPTNLTLEDDASTATVMQDGTSMARMLVQWTPPQDSDVYTSGHIQVQYALISGSNIPPSSPIPMAQLTSGQWQTVWIDAGEVSGASTSMYIDGIYEWTDVLVQIRSVRANGQTSSWVQTPLAHKIYRPIPIISLGNANAMQLSYSDGTLIQSLQPAQPGADVTAQNTSAYTASLTNHTSDNLAAGLTTAIPYRVALPGLSTASWVKLGTWVMGNSANGSSLKIECHTGAGNNSGAGQQSIVDVLIRSGNGANAPNISGVSAIATGSAVSSPIAQVAAVATGGSTAPNCASWDILLNLSAFAQGFALVMLADGDTFTYSGASGQTAPTAGTTAVVATTGVPYDHQGSVTNLGGVGTGSLINPGAGGSGLDFILDGGSFRRVSVGAFNGNGNSQFTHSAMSTEVQQVISTSSELIETTTISGGLVLSDLSTRVSTAIETTGAVQNLGGVTAASITPIAGLMPAQAGADVTAQNTSAYTASLTNHTSDNLAAGLTTAIPYRVAIPGQSTASWVKLGTWVTTANPGNGTSLKIECHTGAGFNTGNGQQSLIDILVRSGNGSYAPNISGVSAIATGSAVSSPISQVAAVATGGSTSAANNSWDILLNLGPFASGFALVMLADGDTFTYSGASGQTAPTAGTTAVVATTGVPYDHQGNLKLKNIAAVPGVTANPSISSSWTDLPELGSANPAMTFTTQGNPVLIASELLFSASPTGGYVSNISVYFGSTNGSAPPTISITISGNGSGASASVTWRQSGSTWYPSLTITGGSGYTSATATVTVTANGDPNYTSGTNTYPCTIAGAGQVSGALLSVRILMDGTVVAGPYPLTTDNSGNAIFTGTQLVTPVPSAGPHAFQVQAMTSSGAYIYSTSRSFQLVELG